MSECNHGAAFWTGFSPVPGSHGVRDSSMDAPWSKLDVMDRCLCSLPLESREGAVTAGFCAPPPSPVTRRGPYGAVPQPTPSLASTSPVCPGPGEQEYPCAAGSIGTPLDCPPPASPGENLWCTLALVHPSWWVPFPIVSSSCAGVLRLPPRRGLRPPFFGSPELCTTDHSLPGALDTISTPRHRSCVEWSLGDAWKWI